MSINNILLTAETEPTHRYAKTIRSKIAGFRLDPLDNKQVPFLLTSVGDEFSYEDEVVELYSDKENRYFMQANKLFIANGYLKPFNGTAAPVAMDNIISDEDVERIAAIRTPNQLKSKLAPITSKVSLERVVQAAREIGRPQSIINIIESRIKDL